MTNDHLLSFQRHQEGRVTEQEDTQRSDLEGTTANYENIDKTNGYLITGSSVCDEQESQVIDTQPDNEAYVNTSAANEVDDTSRSRSQSRSVASRKKQTYPLRVRKQVFSKESVGTSIRTTAVAEKTLSHAASAVQYQGESSIKGVGKPSEPTEPHSKQLSREENSQYIFKDPEQDNCSSIPAYDSSR